jgi:hypothetical protein
MSQVDRKIFVPIANNAYNDVAQVIGYGATISAPHMVRSNDSKCLNRVTSNSFFRDALLGYQFGLNLTFNNGTQGTNFPASS